MFQRARENSFTSGSTSSARRSGSLRAAVDLLHQRLDELLRRGQRDHARIGERSRRQCAQILCGPLVE